MAGHATTGTSLGQAMAELAAADPARPALSCANQRLTRADLERRTNRLARAYRELGVREASFVTIGLPNGIEFVEAVLATWKLGAVPQPVSHRLPSSERTAIIDLVDPALVVGVAPEEAGSGASVPSGFTPDPGLSDGPLPPAVPPAWKAPTSGGSTGRPKIVVAGEPGVVEQLAPYAELFRIEREATLLATGPLHHNGPFINTMLALLGGGHAVVMPRFDAETALRAVEQERVTWMYMVPTMMHRIWRLPERVRRSYDISSLRTVLHTAAPCPSWLKQAWIDWLGPERIFEIYGGTEAQAMTALDGAEWTLHPGSVGRVSLGEMRVLDEEGRELPAGERGRIWMRRGADAPATYRYIGADPVRREQGWEWLGDTGHVDPDGYVHVADRWTDLILVGGSNVYPAEVESALDEHASVASSCVFGVPDPDLGAVPLALVQVSDRVGEDELRTHLAARLVSYKHPHRYEFVDHPLRDDSGKVRRAERRADWMARQPDPDNHRTSGTPGR